MRTPRLRKPGKAREEQRAKMLGLPGVPHAQNAYATLLGDGPLGGEHSPASLVATLSHDLLMDAISTLENVVAKKRGQGEVTGIRSRWAGAGYLAIACRLGALQEALEPRKSGRKAKPKQARRPRGRPLKWTLDTYGGLIQWHQRGVELLRAKRARITNVAAFREFILSEQNNGERLPDQLVRDWSKEFAKRLPDARRALLRKPPPKS